MLGIGNAAVRIVLVASVCRYSTFRAQWVRQLSQQAAWMCLPCFGGNLITHGFSQVLPAGPQNTPACLLVEMCPPHSCSSRAKDRHPGAGGCPFIPLFLHEYLFHLTFADIQSLKPLSWGWKASCGTRGTIAREAEPAFDV